MLNFALMIAHSRIGQSKTPQAGSSEMVLWN
jgi:hypothetical protein